MSNKNKKLQILRIISKANFKKHPMTIKGRKRWYQLPYTSRTNITKLVGYRPSVVLKLLDELEDEKLIFCISRKSTKRSINSKKSNKKIPIESEWKKYQISGKGLLDILIREYESTNFEKLEKDDIPAGRLMKTFFPETYKILSEIIKIIPNNDNGKYFEYLNYYFSKMKADYTIGENEDNGEIISYSLWMTIIIWFEDIPYTQHFEIDQIEAKDFDKNYSPWEILRLNRISHKKNALSPKLVGKFIEIGGFEYVRLDHILTLQIIYGILNAIEKEQLNIPEHQKLKHGLISIVNSGHRKKIFKIYTKQLQTQLKVIRNSCLRINKIGDF